MPLSWVGRRDGGQASASPRTDREGIPAGRGYTSARVGRRPDSGKYPKKKNPKRGGPLIGSNERSFDVSKSAQ